MNFKIFKKGVVLGVVILAICALSVPAAFAQAVPGGTLDPLQIPKYVTPLVIPPALYDDGGANMSVDVALRQFSQQVLPTIGCTAASAAQVAAGGDAIACVGDAFPATTLWGYGDPANPATFNNPSLTIEVTKDTATTVKWINGLTTTGAAGGNYLPHIIQDAAGNPVIDQTLHWANPNGPVDGCLGGATFTTDCRGNTSDPYTGPIPMVTHVHGAHVAAVSDGYPEAWWLPAADDLPEGYATGGTLYDDTADSPSSSGYAVYAYSNDQPTTTLWYHDHSLGITRLNVYAASAGFWLIRTAADGETGVVSGTLPGPAPGLWSAGAPDPSVIREIPIAIQPKSFNANGSQFYPADRAFFEGLGTGGTYADNNDVNIDFLPTNTSDISPVWNPEAFFNTMTVNGNTWPVLEVAPERYRFRLLNASDSRFMNLSLHQVNGQARKLREIPFYQIGSEQGLLPQVVRIETGFATPLPGNGTNVDPMRPDCLLPNGKLKKNCVPAQPGTFAQQALLMGPAERPDVIVDFTGRANGDMIVMFNTGPDAPFGGFPDVPADPATTGQVMMFRVNAALANPAGDPSTPPASLVLDANPGGAAKLGPSSVTRDLALLEEESALICVDVDAITGVITQVPNSTPPDCSGGGAPFAPKAAVLGINGSNGGTVTLWADDIETNPGAYDGESGGSFTAPIETWELWNWSADAHPIHLHLVKFEVLNREVIDSGAPRNFEPWEAGWKDTLIAYPGEITRLKAKFDIEGLYVWHCHILSHEDNEMMVPYYVGDPCDSPVPVAGAVCDGG